MRLNDKSGRRNQPRLLPVLALACAFLAAALAVASGKPGQTTGGRKKPVFDEAELERYRVDIHPVTPDTGIVTGYLFACGRYIEPPYSIVATAGVVYANGVRLSPPLPVPPREHKRNPWSDTDAGKHYEAVASRIRVTRKAAIATYLVALAQGLPHASAFAAAESVFAADTLIDSVVVQGTSTLDFFGPEVELVPGHRMSYQEGLTLTPSGDTSKSDPAARQSLAEQEADVVRATLANGRCQVFHSGGSGNRRSGFVQQLVDIMTEAELSDQLRWVGLLAYVGAAEAYAYVANRADALRSWAALAERREREK